MTISITVDRSRCESHGACALIAPDLFRIDSDGDLQHQGTARDDRAEAAEEAADLCPVQAIIVAPT